MLRNHIHKVKRIGIAITSIPPRPTRKSKRSSPPFQAIPKTHPAKPKTRPPKRHKRNKPPQNLARLARPWNEKESAPGFFPSFVISASFHLKSCKAGSVRDLGVLSKAGPKSPTSCRQKEDIIRLSYISYHKFSPSRPGFRSEAHIAHSWMCRHQKTILPSPSASTLTVDPGG